MTGRSQTRMGRRIRTLGSALALCALLAHPAAAGDVNSGGQTFIPQKVLEGKLIPITGDFRSVDLDIRFRFGSAELTDTARRQLDALAGALEAPELKAAQVQVNGHTDAVGTAAQNKLLSEKRAAAVVSYLVREKGLEQGRFTAHGYGEERLLPHLAPNSAGHRRVEIVTTLPEAKEPDKGGIQVIGK